MKGREVCESQRVRGGGTEREKALNVGLSAGTCSQETRSAQSLTSDLSPWPASGCGGRGKGHIEGLLL